ncbi:LysR family transcriptional regulator [Paludisphaera mucosa]|uniref:LysR family transcriptional regulator n=1 Tax=Paludisphaera mucosa TaxID=3030827 RepID=A0ABT6F852_9BACT|nr:LysR family transcriptional regulator [Paludisphaera mucosa]MDG3003753.1 LysR family transcriptional regulator [Paludisphaera mucosa]
MQFESLQIFCDVVRWASFSRGASENKISQSSASQAVHQLEVRLGVRLIDRSKRPLVLTEEGRVYYEGCRDLVARYLELENRIRTLSDERRATGTVGVAAIYSVGLLHMSRYVKTFAEHHPEASVRLEYLHPTQVVERVSGGDVELGLISYPRKWPDLAVIPWREETMVLVVAPGHRFARRETVHVRELDGETLVGFDSELSIRKAIDRFLRRHDVAVDVALEFDNIENIKRAVEISAGVAILPEPSVAEEIRAGTLAALAIDGQDPKHRLTRPLAIIHRRNEKLDITTSRFLELLTGRDGDPEAADPAAGRRVPAASSS